MVIYKDLSKPRIAMQSALGLPFKKDLPNRLLNLIKGSNLFEVAQSAHTAVLRVLKDHPSILDSNQSINQQFSNQAIRLSRPKFRIENLSQIRTILAILLRNLSVVMNAQCHII